MALVVEAKTKVKTGWRGGQRGRDFGLHRGEEGQRRTQCMGMKFFRVFLSTRIIP